MSQYLPIIIAVLVMVALSAAFLLYACCYVSGTISREEEKRDGHPD